MSSTSGIREVVIDGWKDLLDLADKLDAIDESLMLNYLFRGP
jgi:hypothetical protein